MKGSPAELACAPAPRPSAAMEIQIRRNKIQIFRNEIQAEWNKSQIRRNKNQIQNPSISFSELSLFNDLRSTPASTSQVQADSGFKRRGDVALCAHLVVRRSVSWFPVPPASLEASEGQAPFYDRGRRPSTLAPFPSDPPAAEPHRGRRGTPRPRIPES